MFGLMYLNTYALEHVTYSQTRTWMALLMGAVMAVIMTGFMWSMYANKRANALIIAASAAIFACSLWLVRSQETVNARTGRGSRGRGDPSCAPCS